MDIIRLFRIILSIEGVSTRTLYAFFNAMSSLLENQNVCERILKDELFPKVRVH